jgi:hypothetical protein
VHPLGAIILHYNTFVTHLFVSLSSHTHTRRTAPRLARLRAFAREPQSLKLWITQPHPPWHRGRGAAMAARARRDASTRTNPFVAIHPRAIDRASRVAHPSRDVGTPTDAMRAAAPSMDGWVGARTARRRPRRAHRAHRARRWIYIFPVVPDARYRPRARRETRERRRRRRRRPRRRPRTKSASDRCDAMRCDAMRCASRRVRWTYLGCEGWWW